MQLIFTLDEIEKAAATFREMVDGERVIAFHGEMGAGKTTFISALCKTLGVIDAISSPTFSIINQYKTNSGSTVYHMDLYRIKDEEEALMAGVEECFYSGSWCFVEWPEKTPSLFPDNTVECHISNISINERKLQINL